MGEKDQRLARPQAQSGHRVAAAAPRLWNEMERFSELVHAAFAITRHFVCGGKYEIRGRDVFFRMEQISLGLNGFKIGVIDNETHEPSTKNGPILVPFELADCVATKMNPPNTSLSVKFDPAMVSGWVAAGNTIFRKKHTARALIDRSNIRDIVVKGGDTIGWEAVAECKTCDAEGIAHKDNRYHAIEEARWLCVYYCTCDRRPLHELTPPEGHVAVHLPREDVEYLRKCGWGGSHRNRMVGLALIEACRKALEGNDE